MSLKRSLSAIFTLLCLFTLTGIIYGHPEKPILISPGEQGKEVVLATDCPTFSWSILGKAAGYEIAVFSARSDLMLSYEEMLKVRTPILSKSIHAQSGTWTLPYRQRLKRHSRYVWYARALGNDKTGSWSEGRFFTVISPLIDPNTVAELKNRFELEGVPGDLITQVFTDFNKQRKDSKTLSGTHHRGILGNEGDSNYNTYYGTAAGIALDLNPTTGGLRNSFFGHQAGIGCTTADDSTFIGHYAGSSATGNSENTFVGSYAGYETETIKNTFIGAYSGRNNSSGAENMFAGCRSGFSNTTGDKNTFLGYYAGWMNSTANNNTFVGYHAGIYNSIGYNNTFVGKGVGENIDSGNRNCFFGSEAGFSNQGNLNIFIGYQAGYSESGSNKLYIDSSNTSSPLIYGEFDNNILAVNGHLGIGTHSPSSELEVEATGTSPTVRLNRTDGSTFRLVAGANNTQIGSESAHGVKFLAGGSWEMQLKTDGSLLMNNGASCTTGGVWQNASSRALKKNIKAIKSVEAKETLKGLNPVTFNYIKEAGEQYAGFIAEDVPDLVATKTRKQLNAMDIVAVLTKVVKDQTTQLEALEQRLKEQRRELNSLKRLLQKRKK